MLVRLTPRQYSISSSPLVSPHEVQLTVSVVRYRGADGAGAAGCARRSSPTAPRAAPVFLQRSPHFRPPEDGATPMIMVGPAPASHRSAASCRSAARSATPAATGCSSATSTAAENFYYRDDLEDMVRDGLLNRLDLAFSRDQAERVYVQHKMLDYGADVWRWLEDGAHFYVCGDATRMAKDVDAALTDDHPKARRDVRRSTRTTTSASWSPRSATCATCISNTLSGCGSPAR